MSYEFKFLIDKLIEKFGGIIKRINRRTFWNSPDGKLYHVNTVFLRRMATASKPEETKQNDQPKQEVAVNGRAVESRQPEPRSKEVEETVAKVEEERVVSETPKKKKKDRPKKTKPKVEDAPQQGQEEVKDQQ